MSSQNSTTEDIREKTSSAYDTVANTIAPTSQNEGSYDPSQDKKNFAKDTHGNTFRKGDFKDQLNEAANGGRKQESAQQERIVDKVLSYIPGVSSSQKSGDQSESQRETTHPAIPPKRPEHDVQVEQFLRKQYHSAAGDGMPDPDK